MNFTKIKDIAQIICMSLLIIILITSFSFAIIDYVMNLKNYEECSAKCLEEHPNNTQAYLDCESYNYVSKDFTTAFSILEQVELERGKK